MAATALLDQHQTWSGRPPCTTVREDLKAFHGGDDIATLDVAQWISSGQLDLAGARALIATAATKRKWFKTISNGEALGEFVWARIDGLASTPFGATLTRINRSIYGDEPPSA